MENTSDDEYQKWRYRMNKNNWTITKQQKNYYNTI